jgi:putative nucleotidyltransferase with HDIG domain
VRAIHFYVLATVLVALALILTLDWGSLEALPRSALTGFVALTALGLFSEASSAFSYRVGPEGGRHSLVFLPLVAAVLLFGPTLAVLFILVTAAVTEFFIRKKEIIRATFNTAQYVNSTVVAGLLFSYSGGYALALSSPPQNTFDAQIGPIVVFGVVALILNHLAVSVALGFSERAKWRAVVRLIANRIVGTIINDLMVLPIAILVAYLYFELRVPGLFIALLPLLFIRYSYLSKFRLEAANRDLLQVLVKAIETRDPYTSGHSIRVQSLSKSIGEELGLSIRTIEQLETAALLHDVGKIEVVYEEILRKPSGLSDQEKKIIESHVERGVEILTSLSSFNSRIIAGIRHHHELYDGSGYPDGLSGNKIPLYARIIKVSDAIDAMLSTRPYRPALSIENVHSELEKFSSKHFDPDIVKVIVRSSILAEHATMVQLDRARTDGGKGNDAHSVTSVLFHSTST